jgi:hypothetical protein
MSKTAVKALTAKNPTGNGLQRVSVKLRSESVWRELGNAAGVFADVVTVRREEGRGLGRGRRGRRVVEGSRHRGD